MKRNSGQRFQGGEGGSLADTAEESIQMVVSMCRGPETIDAKAMEQQVQRP